MEVSKGLIKAATDFALKGETHYKLGAIIYSNGNKIVSGGYNQIRLFRNLHPRFQHESYKAAICAEKAAILNAKTDLKGLTMLVVRLNAKGELRLARPCKRCSEFIQHVGIKRVIYSVWGGFESVNLPDIMNGAKSLR